MDKTPKVISVVQAKQFILGGKAVITVSNGRGDHYTYQFRHHKFPDGQDRFFVKVLSKPDNESDSSYTYVGMMYPSGTFILTKGSTYTMESPCVKVIMWMLARIKAGRELPLPASLRHEGLCGRCGRKLTTPASVDTGFGPHCSAALGIEWLERPVSEVPRQTALEYHTHAN
jgi:hypothetical protein